MIRKTILLVVITFSFCVSPLFSQDFNVDRFSDISNTELDFSTGNVSARMIEGLGFRYYWATYELNETDLEYRASESGRSSLETIEHIYGLTSFMISSLKLTPAGTEGEVGFEDLRKNTLINLEILERKFKSMNADQFKEFKSGDITFWHIINGPIADALWHTGQIVMLRRASGNPLPKGVNVLMGTKS